MKPYYGEQNQNGQWWDGKDWRNYPEQEDKKGTDKLILRQVNYLKTLDDKNCHADGCFTCPRCRLPHYIVGNYDLLCDGCVKEELSNDSNVEKEILEWIDKSRLHFRGVTQAEILERIKLRDDLEKSNHMQTEAS